MYGVGECWELWPGRAARHEPHLCVNLSQSLGRSGFHVLPLHKMNQLDQMLKTLPALPRSCPVFSLVVSVGSFQSDSVVAGVLTLSPPFVGLALPDSMEDKLYSLFQGILSDDHGLAAALWRTFFNQKCEDPRQLELLVEYVRKQVSRPTPPLQRLTESRSF